MVWETYEISLWTHNDVFVSTLVQSGEYYYKEGFSPTFSISTNGEISLSFTIPIIFFDKSTGQWKDNTVWYNKLRNTGLSNEQKVKLIFDKNKKDSNGKYIHKIYETIITNIEEKRDGQKLLCEVTCSGYAFKWLGKTGYNIVMDSETVLLEEEKDNTTIYPNINYWMDKVFPKNDDGSWATDWGYEVRMNYSGIGTNRDSSKIYEDDDIINWSETDSGLKPIYNSEPIEKQRFPNIAESNKYNITQDLAELFEVFIKYEFLYEDAANPFKITRGMVVFYNELPEYTEYAITYQDNETGLSKTSNSEDITTKLYVPEIETEYSDNGYISIADAPNNITKDNFILNFDYFAQSGQLTTRQINAIPKYQLDIREINTKIDDNTAVRNSVENKIVDCEIEVNSISAKMQSAQDIINDYSDKLSSINSELTTNILTDTKIAYIVNEDSNHNLYINFKRGGVIASSIKCETSGTSFSIKETDSYGFVKSVSISGVSSGKIVYFTYKYDLLSYYRNEIQTYNSVNDSLISKYNEKKAILGDKDSSSSNKDGTLYEQLNYYKNEYNNLLKEKNNINLEFENLMGYFLKEGNWNTTDYEAPAENKYIDNCSIFYDTVPLDGEQLAYYLVGVNETKTYYNYIDIETIKNHIPNIEELVIIEKWSDNSINYQKQYMYNSQYTVQFMRVNGENHCVLLFDSTVNIDTNSHKIYYKDADGNEEEITSLYKSGADNQNELVYRRYILQDSNIITSSIKITNSGKTLEEYYDYFISTSGTNKVITFKCTNNVLPNYSNFSISYKCDRSTSQFFYDAQDVLQTSAFPLVSYDVSFAYLQKRLNKKPIINIPSQYKSISKNLNDEIELNLGSIVRINDYQLSFRGVKGIVKDITLVLDEPQNNTFTIQNYKTRFEDLFGRIVASSEQMKANSISYNRAASAITPTQEVVGSIIQNTINNNKLIFYSGYTSGVTFDDYGITVENTYPYPNGVTGQLLLRGGNILLSDQIDADGNRIYTTGISPAGINASVITTGRLDTEKINIYSGDQVRFSWNADGLNAYSQYETGETNYNKFIRFNQDGLLYSQNNFKSVELGWNGLYLGAQDGSVELTANNGLAVYNGDINNTNRVALVRLGRFGTSDNYDYGLRLYDTNEEETLITSNQGELWLKKTLKVGSDSDDSALVGITGEASKPDDKLSPIRIWAGNSVKEEALFIVRNDGSLESTKATINGNIYAKDGEFSGIIHAKGGEFSGLIKSEKGNIGGWEIDGSSITKGSVSLLSTQKANESDIPVRIIAGNNGTFKVYDDGTIEARKGIIGNLTIEDISNLEGVVDSVDSAKVDFGKEGIKIYNGGFKIYKTEENLNKEVFYTDKKGNLTLSGVINSYGGSIGAWIIDINGLTTDNNTVGIYANDAKKYNDESIRFWAGQKGDNYNFVVTDKGSLYANNATISGSINASDGHIENMFLVGGNDNGIILYGDKNGINSYIGSTQYASGTLGYGWKLSQDGTAEFSNIYARGKIQSSVFEYKKISSIGGSLYVAPTIYFDYNSDPIYKQDGKWRALFKISWKQGDNINGRSWEPGDLVKISGTLIKEQNKIELDNIDGYIDYFKKNGENYLGIIFNYEIENGISNYIFIPGTMIILHGSNNKRYGLYLTAADKDGPYIDVYQDDDDNVTKPAVRIGNLQGIVDSNFPTNSLQGYGLYSSNAYLRGQLMLPGAGITNQNNNIYEGSPIRIWAGINDNNDIANSNFIVTENGHLYAKEGIFEGVVKATNSEFSGTIKAAGIVVDEKGQGTNPKSNTDHFFVGYKETPTTFNDYILDISSKGLSIWEGGLRAYSDYASAIDGSEDFNPVYGYNKDHLNPLPYFSLADDGDGQILNARMIAHKAHFITVDEIGDSSVSYNTNSIIIDNGIWFSNNNYEVIDNIEHTAYYNNNKKSGILLNNEILNISSDKGLMLNGKTTYITTNTDDINESRNESLFIRGQVKVINDTGDNTISLNQCIIQEAKDVNKNSIGLNFIVK